MRKQVSRPDLKLGAVSYRTMPRRKLTSQAPPKNTQRRLALERGCLKGSFLQKRHDSGAISPNARPLQSAQMAKL